MDTTKEAKKGEEDVKRAKARITLTCKNLKSVEKASNEIITRGKKIEEVEVKGPVRMPTKILVHTVRKSPCGEGSKTWERYEMRIYKRVIDLTCCVSDIKNITNFRIDPGVEIELTITSDE
ncbi:ribosomal protein, putative [Ichthyophthirius multifiliis]|uniref:Small ribosomal subunit protein uS10 n=1 Tax=Ichthyophthirius multifiliis TaxID=5932 RepID=G0QX05_ICHMU|nr:ribosomal protein, putative [Ichthyophthirius multifiliis]EGR30253.1 ribosomal protein, putative [Ichthyophthirius multifiliis]|eukprot:XP_004031849.1 ribosomal protein, putative [Ichthyophthirius multifiliis]